MVREHWLKTTTLALRGHRPWMRSLIVLEHYRLSI